jgi:hypothetical protein
MWLLLDYLVWNPGAIRVPSAGLESAYTYA